MATKKQTKTDIVYRGINLFEKELDIIITSLKKAKTEGVNDIIKYLTQIKQESEEE